MKESRTLNVFVFCFTVMTTLFFATSALADFEDNHPRRYQVNQREAHQAARVAAGAAQGQLSSDQVAAYNAREAQIKNEEVSERQANGGYITKAQQQNLNSELNEESQVIHSERHPAAASSDSDD